MVLPGETIMAGANNGKFGTNGYSQLKVMSSAAGYYLGTEYTNTDGFTQPGSRESGYFITKKQAEHALNEWHAGNCVYMRRP